MTYNEFEAELNRLKPRPEDFIESIIPPQNMGLGSFLRTYMLQEFIDRYNDVVNHNLPDLSLILRPLEEF